MRIQTIEITNYKAFLGTHKIAVDGKNVFIYGENGSGKSSLYYALKDFFQSSMEDIDLTKLENIFVPAGKEGKTAVKINFKPNHLGQNKKKTYVFNAATIDTRSPGDTSIRDGSRLKSFLTYKHLLAIHYLKKDEEINLFNLLVTGVLKHFKYSLTGGKELGELWDDVDETGEKAIEDALVHHTVRFLLELGAGIAFIGRQVLIEVGYEGFLIDLLFSHL
jgi:energy-coupling factor transporter ATP-binding protein EcfA2